LRPEDWQTAHQLVVSLPGVLEVQTYGEALHILVDSSEKRLPELIKTLSENGIPHYGARPAPARMEEAFISLIRRMEESDSQPEET
jgi:hypothetical protein